MNENPQEQLGSQYLIAPDRITRLEQAVHGLATAQVELVDALNEKFNDIAKAFQALYDYLEGKE